MERRISPWIFLVFLFNADPAFGEDCPVTREVTYENDAIGVVLPHDGKFVFRPNGPGFVDHDGALGIKVGWDRKIPGRLDITGRRLDAVAPPARAYLVDQPNTPTGQGTYVVFPTPGCWEIVGRVGDQALTFVVAVELIAPGPAAHFDGVPRGWRQTGG